jgi:NAD(P)-dependent dehydrogenase (short-subunit alcohol dehydrogenase family)
MDVPGFALITGAASGIGLACAKTFASEGCAGIALLDINADSLSAAKSTILDSTTSKSSTDGQSNGVKPACRIETFTVDVTSEEDVERVVNEVNAKFGRIDYVVNAAGVACKHAGGVAFAKSSDWHRILDINLTGTFHVLRATSRIMLDQSPTLSSRSSISTTRGSIVNFSSIQGLVGITLSAAYTASKHAIIGLTRSASEDYASKGLRINCVAPGYTETPMTTANPDVRKAMEERVGTAVPMGRMGKPEEIADAVIWLAGGRSSFVTGSCLVVDGGFTER